MLRVELFKDALEQTQLLHQAAVFVGCPADVLKRLSDLNDKVNGGDKVACREPEGWAGHVRPGP